MTDGQIAQRLRQNDSSVFDYIMERYNKLLWAVIGNILNKAGTSEDIEDCISDVYIKLLENPKIYSPEKGEFKSFLVKVGKNLAIDRYRKLTKNAFAMAFEYDGVSNTEDMLQLTIRNENREELLAALTCLKEPDREILVRRYFFNEKVKVISKKMRMQSKEIENRLYQGKLKIKKRLEKKVIL